MKKQLVTWRDVEHQVQEILCQMQRDRWMPDYVIGLTRGGLIPANMISQYLDIPMHTLKVNLRDHAYTESNTRMAEDAFNMSKEILIVDDINDSGATLSWIKQDWQLSCQSGHSDWNNVWNNNVKVATLFDNDSSKSELTVDYSAVTINKAEEDVWIDFPWESWWTR
jgi:hypoxanthine phosphoribosyltransferase